MGWLKIFPLLFILNSAVVANYISIIGSLINRDASNYKVYVSTSELSKDILLAMQLDCEQEFPKVERIYFDKDSEKFQEVSFEIPHNAHRNCRLYALMRNNNNICMSNQLVIVNDRDSILLIQTNKPIYKTEDTVHFQVIALDGDTKPVEIQKIHAEIYDAKDRLVHTIDESNIDKKEFGYYSGSFVIAKEPNVGTWTIKVKINREEFPMSKTFVVQEYKSPRFKLYIETPPRASFSDSVINLKISGKYSFEKLVKGNAKITAKLFYPNNPNRIVRESSKNVALNSDEKTVQFHMKNDFKLNFLVKNILVDFDVELIEDRTNLKVQEAKRVEVFVKAEHMLHVSKKETFLPGMPYVIKVYVEKFNGQPEMSTSLPVAITTKYISDQGDDYKQYVAHAFLAQGKVNFFVYPSKQTTRLDIEIKFEKVVDSFSVNAQNTPDETFIQINVISPVIKVGSNLELSIASNSAMEILNAVVVGKGGIILTQNYPESSYEETYNITLPVTKEMTPEVNVFVYYIKENSGDVIYDSIKIELGYLSENFLKITSQQKQVMPRTNINLSIQTKAESLVGLLGIDQSTVFLGTGNIITQEELNKKLLAHAEVSYPYSIDSKQIKALIPQNTFILNLSKGNQRRCTGEENSLGSEGQSSVIGKASWRQERKIVQPTKQSFVRKYFPDMWIYETLTTDQETTKIDRTVPDSITSWLINGFSISKDFGFAIGNTEQVTAFKDLFIDLEVPYSVKVGEEVQVKAIVYNYINVASKVTVKLMSDKKFQNLYPGENKVLFIIIPASSPSIFEFRIKILLPGDVNIHVQAKRGASSDDIMKTIKSGYAGVTQSNANTAVLRPSQQSPNSGRTKLNIPRQNNGRSVNFELSVAGNALGPTLDVSKNTAHQTGSSEEKMQKFASALISLQTLAKTGKLTIEREKELKTSIMTSYQEVLKIANSDGSFNLFVDNSGRKRDNVMFTAYVAKLLSQAKDYTDVDESLISKAMDYVTSKQMADGSFGTNGQEGVRQFTGFSGDRIVSTAHVLISLLESESLKNNYADIIDQGIDYLKSKENVILTSGKIYEKAIMFYTFALTNEYKETLYNQLKNSAKKENNMMSWQYGLSAHEQIEVASYVLLGLTRLEKLLEGYPIFEFIVSKRNADGEFTSSQDTVLGQQAIAEVSMALQEVQNNLQVKITSATGFTKTINITPNNSLEVQKVNLPENTFDVEVFATGQGTASLSLSNTFNTETNNKPDFFDITVTPNKISEWLELKICVGTKGSVSSNMAKMEVKLPSGYVHHSGPTGSEAHLRKTEFEEEETLIIFYFDYLEKTKTCLDLDTRQKYAVFQLQNGIVTVREFYDREKTAMKTFAVSEK